MRALEVLVLEPAGAVQSSVTKTLRDLKLFPSVSGSMAHAIAHARRAPLAAVIADVGELVAGSGDLKRAIRQLQEAQEAVSGSPGLTVIVTSPADDLKVHTEALEAGAMYLTVAAAATKVILELALARLAKSGPEHVAFPPDYPASPAQVAAPASAETADPESSRLTVMPKSSGVSRHVTDVFALRDEHLRSPESGRWDAQLIASAFGISLKELSEAIGVRYNTVHKTPDSEGLQSALAPFANVLAMLHQTYKGEERQIRMWLRSPQVLLGGKTPLEGLLMPGKASGVELLVTNAWLGIPA